MSRYWVTGLIGVLCTLLSLVACVLALPFQGSNGAESTTQTIAEVEGLDQGEGKNRSSRSESTGADLDRFTVELEPVSRFDDMREQRLADLEAAKSAAKKLRKIEKELKQPAEFRVSSFNVLGASHTVNGGRGKASGTTRIRWTLDLFNSYGVDVAGLQEFQYPQYLEFMRASGNSWGVYPGASLGKYITVHNSIVWRKSVWDLVQARTITIPYLRGSQVPMPYVLLRHRATGKEVWFANFHNAADVRGPAQHLRNQATTLEINLVNRLSADGTPVILTGDMNDRAPYFCPVTQRSQMHAANGGSTGSVCRPPPRMDVDWIFGSADITFSNFVSTKAGLVSRASDHPIVVATAVAR